jgi:hypothetical protein
LAVLRASILPALTPEYRRSAVDGLRNSALQSRGGDGWRSFRELREERSVFPSTKSAVIVEGQFRPLWITKSSERTGARKTFTMFQAKC